MTRSHIACLLALMLSACAPSSSIVGDDGGGGDAGTDDSGETGPDPAPTIGTISGPAVLDGLRTTDATWQVDLDGASMVDITLQSDVGGVLAVLADDLDVGDGAGATVTWDLRTDAGEAVDPTGLSLVVEAVSPDGLATSTATASVAVVHMGAVEGTFIGDRIELCWHMAGGPGLYWDDGATERTFLVEGFAAEGADGLEPVDVPTVWDDLFAPPDEDTTQNMPVVYAWDSQPQLSLVLGGDLPSDLPSGLALSVEGWTVTEGDLSELSTAGQATVVLTKDEALTDGPGVVEDALVIEWVTADPTDTAAAGQVVGSQEIPVRIYATMGPATFEENGAPHLPWVAVLDPALRAIDGVTPTDEDVLDALVEHIFYDYGLEYDTRSGASVYMSYRGGGSSWYDGGHMDLTGFMELRNGTTVNCSDCSGILGAYGNMIGIPLDYSIIGWSFRLNQIKAIGGDEHTNCPFGPSGCGFSYHAVTTTDLSQTIWDATLALDGDDDPINAPSTDLLVQQITGSEYLSRLSYSSGVAYYYEQRATIQ